MTLDGLNIDGLVHITELGRDYFHFDAARHALIGERSGRDVPARRPRCACASRASTSRQTKIDFTLADEPMTTMQEPELVGSRQGGKRGRR